ncbi:hypothetical protein JRO89_XS03G0309500 [Xanthoceras sorbifolium]|uniref:Root phototropism protein 3-like n=1 Tax=Xanthoceras sorbifolium TaxID=99658 RepID=A0ABQ8IE85_9ROSI|nr:hypothetical protein JRO89_XS03G0309500 [Xanthoceras sorbifolium]
MGRKSFDRENPARCSVSGGKPSRCVIFPANVSVVAEALEKRNKNWIVRTKIASDLIVQVGDFSFHLHKLPMVSKSEYLNRLVFKRRSNGERGNSPKIHLENLPGGTETFELVVKFCYGWKVDVTATNIAALYSAAHFLEMSNDLEQGNLISKTEAFLNFVMFSSWKDTFQILKSCESVPSWAKELHILKRCSEAIAWRACINPKAFDLDDFEANKTKELKPEGIVHSSWWFEDVSALRIDHFIEVIESIKQKGMRSELVGSCISKWTAKWLSQITFGLNNITPKHLTRQLRRVTTESLIRILPEEEYSVPCNFLLHLLKLGLLMKINSELSKKLERRIASMLEQCCIQDLLVKNHGENETVYDVETVIRVVECYVSSVLRVPAPRIYVVGRLVDGYLTLVAWDKNLKAKSFQLLAQALPKTARHCDNNLYGAMDIYLKEHPNLTEEERISVCKAMEYHKLSQEARQHMMKNDRLPVKLRTQFILLEQVNMTRSMTDAGSNFQRTKAQAIIRVSKGLEKRWKRSQTEINMMKKEVETMKMQLNQLNMCKIELQKQVKSWH